MENKKGYIVLEVGFEYDDEYYSTGNYGPMYEKPKKIFLNKEKAVEVWKKESVKKLRGLTLGLYFQDGGRDMFNKGMQDKGEQIMQELGIDQEDWEMEIPKTATNEQLEQLLECLKIEFFKVAEIDIE